MYNFIYYKVGNKHLRRYIICKSTTKTVVPSPKSGKAQILNTNITGKLKISNDITASGNINHLGSLTTTNITASGNISASGEILADSYKEDGFGAINTDETKGKVFADPNITGIQIGRGAGKCRKVRCLCQVTSEII